MGEKNQPKGREPFPAFCFACQSERMFPGEAGTETGHHVVDSDFGHRTSDIEKGAFMKARHRAAIELLLSHPDTIVAEMLGIRLSTLRGWMRTDHFAEALRAREMEQESAARRIARQTVLNSAATLCQLASDPAKPDTKVLVEVLKASGAFEAESCDPGAALAEVIRLARAEEADGNEQAQ